MAHAAQVPVRHQLPEVHSFRLRNLELAAVFPFAPVVQPPVVLHHLVQEHLVGAPALAGGHQRGNPAPPAVDVQDVPFPVHIEQVQVHDPREPEQVRQPQHFRPQRFRVDFVADHRAVFQRRRPQRVVHLARFIAQLPVGRGYDVLSAAAVDFDPVLVPLQQLLHDHVLVERFAQQECLRFFIVPEHPDPDGSRSRRVFDDHRHQLPDLPQDAFLVGVQRGSALRPLHREQLVFNEHRVGYPEPVVPHHLEGLVLVEAQQRRRVSVADGGNPVVPQAFRDHRVPDPVPVVSADGVGDGHRHVRFLPFDRPQEVRDRGVVGQHHHFDALRVSRRLPVFEVQVVPVVQLQHHRDLQLRVPLRRRFPQRVPFREHLQEVALCPVPGVAGIQHNFFHFFSPPA